MMSEARNYSEMDMKTTVEAVIRDAKLAGTVTLPLRTEGYHKCSNLLFTDRLN
jgi:adenine-specific DNA methylase